MGTFRLTRLDTSDFFLWVRRSGFRDEMDLWSGLSGLTRGTVVDHMVKYLSSLGYSGQPDDQFRQFLKDQVGLISGKEGTLFDMANKLYQGTFSQGGGTTNRILTEGGDTLTTEAGDALRTEQ